jgi:hypothetical protein
VQRSIGVTINATILLVASVLEFLFLLALLLYEILSASGNSPETSGVAVVLTSIFNVLLMGIVCWEFATAIGLLRLREWARMCSVAVSALACVLIVSALVMFGMVASLSWHAAPNHGLSDESIFMSILCLLAAVHCGWWVYFFQTRSVKDQFRRTERAPAFMPAVAIPAPAIVPTLQTAIPAAPTKSSGRPISITIIAVLFLFAAANAPMSAIMLPAIHLPVSVVGFLVRGWPALVFMLAIRGAGLAAGIGLLNLKPWARILAIYFNVFAILNSLGTLLRPRVLDTIGQAMIARQLQFLSSQPGSEKLIAFAQAIFQSFFHFFMRTTLIGGAIVAIVELWFLIICKQAFTEAKQSPPVSS